MRRAIVTWALVAAACGGPELAVEVATSPAPLESLPAFLSAPDLEAHVRGLAASMAERWGSDGSALDGFTVRFEQQLLACGSAEHAVGCTRGEEPLIQVLAWGAGCVEATALPHEIGHAVIGDAAHADPRWRDPHFWGRMRELAVRAAPAGCDLSDFTARNEVHGGGDGEDHDD